MCDLTRKQREIMRKMQDNGTMYFMDDSPYSSYWFFVVKTADKMIEYRIIDVSILEDLELVKIQWFESASGRTTGIATLTEKGKEWKYESWFERAKKWIEIDLVLIIKSCVLFFVITACSLALIILTDWLFW